MIDHSDHPAPGPAAACPRCGYRLDGVATSWSQRCPLFGTCAECGDAIDWSQVLAPHKYRPRWSFEHAERRRLVRTFIATTWRLALPKRFWTELKMSDAVRPVRLVLFASAILLGLLLALMVVQATASMIYWSQMQSGRLVRSAERYPRAPQSYEYPRPDRPPQIIVPVESVGSPSPFVLDALQRPFAQRVQFIITIDDELWFFEEFGAFGRLQIIVDRISLDAGQGMSDGAGWAMLGSAIGGIATTLIPLSFVMLPWTRARCGVRWRHLGRIWVYSVPIIALITAALSAFGVFAGAFIPGFLVAGFTTRLGTPWAILYACAASASVFIWWGWAMSRHLRLPRPWFVAGLLMLLSIVLVPFVMLGFERLQIMWPLLW